MTSEAQEKVLDLRSVFGLEATVTTPSAATGGEYVELDCTVQPGGDTSIHYHPEQEETYRVLDGTLEVFREGRWEALAAGESLTVPRGAVHGFRNASGVPVRFLNVHRPALAFQEHLETLDRLVRREKIKGLRGPRSLMYMSIASVEQEPSVAVKPPQWLLKGLAFVGRRLGYGLDDGSRRDRGAWGGAREPKRLLLNRPVATPGALGVSNRARRGLCLRGVRVAMG